MPLVRKRLSANADLAEIWEFIADDSEARADAFLEAIDKKFATLADNPNIGRARDELKKGVRSFPVGKYVIFYRLAPGGIEIVRVLHAARDVSILFAADE
jgi:toxin ParE1/3/4